MRNDTAALKLWFERLGRLAPALVLEVRDVWVKVSNGLRLFLTKYLYYQGWPWDTTIIIRWTASMPDTSASSFRFPDGAMYVNHGVHIVRMKWGKAVDIDANEDSQMVDRYLACQAERGVEEASATPIVS